MESVVVDTNVVSYIFKEDTRGDLYHAHLDERVQLVSFMTVAELALWAELHNWGKKRRADLAAFMRRFTVIESDHALCQTWAEMRARVQRAGQHIDHADAWVAATALLYDVPLVTHNRRHFTPVAGLQMISASAG